jgi:hypothetical protein
MIQLMLRGSTTLTRLAEGKGKESKSKISPELNKLDNTP